MFCNECYQRGGRIHIRLREAIAFCFPCRSSSGEIVKGQILKKQFKIELPYLMCVSGKE